MNKQNYILLDLSSKVEYALLALLELAACKERQVPVTMNEIANKQPIPERYLEQILTSLRRAGIVQSQRGAKGGFVLVREPWQITLLDIVHSVEGKRKNREYSHPPTLEMNLVHEIWEQVNSAAVEVLRQRTLEDLYQQRQARAQQGSMYYI